MIEMKMWNEINYINKLDSLKVYLFTQIEAFKLKTIKNSFDVANLVSFLFN